MRNNASVILYKYQNYLSLSERRFLGSVLPYPQLTPRQFAVVQSIRLRARARLANLAYRTPPLLRPAPRYTYRW